MENVYNDLNRYLKGSTHFGTNEGIARFMLAYLDRLPGLRLAEVAQQCHVSAPSVIRFCRELGYEDYTAFKQKAADYLQNPSVEAAPLQTGLVLQGSEAEYADSVRTWLEQEKEHNLRAMLALDRPQMERLCWDIQRHRYVYFFGQSMSGLVAEHIRITLAQFGKNVFALAEPQYDMELTPDKAETLGVVITQHGRMLQLGSHDLLAYLRANCAKTWVITQEPAARRTFPVEETLRVQSGGNMREEFHTMFYFETLLCATYRSLFGQNAQNDNT